MTQKIEDVLGELRSKKSELALAERYGNSLLEEKEHLRKELQTVREEMKQLEETVQHQKHNSQKVLTQAKTEADVLVMDLECQLRSTNNNLDTEQTTHRATKGKQQKELDFLQTENTTLHEKIKTLLGERDNHAERVRKVSASLKQSEAEGQDASVHHKELQKELERLELSNKSFSEDVSTLAHTCDQLTEELQATRTQYDTLEGRFLQLQEECHCQRQELEDSQEMVKQLEAERQRVTGASPTSTMSLHDELSLSLSSLDLIPEDTAWQPRHDTESPSGLKETDSPLDIVNTTNQMTLHMDEDSYHSRVAGVIRRSSQRSLQSGLSTLRRGDYQEAMAAWASTSDDERMSPCPRCTDMQKMVTHYEQELSSVNEQLLGVVGQKIKLQEQNEAWQSDMAEVVHQNLYQRLQKDSSTRRQSKSPNKRKLSSPPNRQDINKIFQHEFIKHSWLF